MITIGKIKETGLLMALRLRKKIQSESPAMLPVQKSSFAKKRRIAKRLRVITGSVIYLKVVLLFVIAAAVASALLTAVFVV